MENSLFNIFILTLGLLSTIIALAMMFIVIWQFSDHQDNRLMASFLFTTVIWGTAFLMFRTIGIETFPFFRIVAWSFIANSFLLFCFTSHYVGLWDNQNVKIILTIGAVYVLILIPIQLTFGLLHNELILTDFGRMIELNTAGRLTVAFTILFTVGNLVLLYKNKVRGRRDLLLGNAILLMAQITIFIPILKDFPIPLVASSITCILFARAILQKNLFNPLKIANEELLISQEGYRQMAQALQISEQLHRNLVKHLPKTATIVFDQNLRYELAQGKGLKEHGYDRKTMIGKTIWEALPPEKASEVEPLYRKALSGMEVNFEKEFNDKHFKLHLLPIKDEQGEILKGLLVIQDVTKAAQLLQQVTENERFIQQITANVPDIIYVYDLVHNTNRYTNHNLMQLLGYTKEDVESMGSGAVRSIIHPDDLDLVLETQAQLQELAQDEIIELEYRLKSKDGKWQHFYSREAIFKYDDIGQATEKIGITQDITIVKEAKEKDLQLILERERTHLLQKFLTDAGHDLMTPLTTIKTTLYLLRRQGDIKSLPRVEQMSIQVERLIKSLQDMLYLARLDSAEYLDMMPYSINDIIKHIAQENKQLIEEKQHKLTLELSPNLPHVHLNGEDIQQALSNILINAIHYTPNKGDISIKSQLDDEQLLIKIKDNGIGIDDIVRDKIFNHFYRGDDARGASGGHSGLGLSISKRIVELHQGSIEVSSILKQYTIFTIKLPLQYQALDADVLN